MSDGMRAYISSMNAKYALLTDEERDEQRARLRYQQQQRVSEERLAYEERTALVQGPSKLCDTYSSTFYLELLTIGQDPQPWIISDSDGPFLTDLFSETPGDTRELMDLPASTYNDVRSLALRPALVVKDQAVRDQDDDKPADSKCLDQQEDTVEPQDALFAVEDDLTPTTKKQNSTKLGLFDLPPELRLEIYKHMCTVILLEHSPRKPREIDSSGRVPHLEASLPINFGLVTTEPTYDEVLPTFKPWQPYNDAFTDLQLISHLLRVEFLSAWAECTLFTLDLTAARRHRSQAELPGYNWDLTLSRGDLAFRIWIALRDSLVDYNIRYLGMGNCIRRFQANCKAHGCPVDLEKYARNARLYADQVNIRERQRGDLSIVNDAGHAFAQSFERLDADLAHPELSVEVRFRSNIKDSTKIWGEQGFAFRQKEFAGGLTGSKGKKVEERKMYEWSCVKRGSLEIAIEHWCKCSGFWHSHELWTSEETALYSEDIGYSLCYRKWKGSKSCWEQRRPYRICRY